MKTRIEDIPKLKTETVIIDSTHYNQVRLGLLRLENPLRVKLTGLRGMDIILDGNSWVCVDRTMYDLPVLAWTDFKNAERTGLHEPIHCQLHFYHIHADLITETVMDVLFNVLAKRLSDKPKNTRLDVTNFPEG